MLDRTMPDEPKERSPDQVRQSWIDRRRAKIVAEIERNRRGDYKVPTWVLVAALVAFVVGWAALVFLT